LDTGLKPFYLPFTLKILLQDIRKRRIKNAGAYIISPVITPDSSPVSTDTIFKPG
jgi:hypothetical protein